MEKKIYYIGFNANNAICNDNFFDGSITLYPTGEKGNIYYSKKIVDRKSKNFNDSYTKYIEKSIKIIKRNNPSAEFTFFNEKIRDLCKNIEGINYSHCNKSEIISFLNDKFEVRKMVKKYVPILEYKYTDLHDTYTDIKNMFKSNEFVLQEKSGAGGENTYLIQNEDDYNNLKKTLNAEKYCLSKYIKNTPLNITLVVFDDDILLLPISAQLIKIIDKKFKYVGADFKYATQISKSVLNRIRQYSNIIGNIIKEKGYRGVIGIDYLLHNENIYFMEINPRFQSSSFLISLELKNSFKSSIAELNYLALNNGKNPNLKIKTLEKSFLNCNDFQNFEMIKEDEIIKNGYYEINKSSFYRKIYNSSIIDKDNFEKMESNNKKIKST